MNTPIYPDYQYVEAYVSGAWTNISSYVISELNGEYGFTSTEDDDRISTVGLLDFVVNNANGHFTPGNANYLGITKDTKIRVRIGFDDTDKVVFIGEVDKFPQTDLSWGDRQFLNITVSTWEDDAAKVPIKTLSVQESKKINQAVASILGIMDKQPTSISYSTGTYTFDRVFDDINVNTRAIAEFTKLAMSEFSYIYTKGDGTLVVEGRADRTGLRNLLTFSEPVVYISHDGNIFVSDDGKEFRNSYATVTGSFSAELLNLEPDYGQNVINQADLTAFSKELDTAYVNLIDYPEPIYLPVGVTKRLNVFYTDPNNRSNKINGYNLQAPSGTLDYVAYQYSTASGTNYTSTLQFDVDYRSNHAEYYIKAQTANCWLTTLKARGNGIYKYQPAEDFYGITGSASTYGIQELRLDQKYQLSLEAGQREAEAILAIEREPRVRGNIGHYLANQSATNMLAFLNGDVGSLIHIQNSESGIDNYYYIHGVRFIITQGGAVEFWWKLKGMFSFRKGLRPIALRYSGLVGSKTGLECSVNPVIDDLPQFTLSGWLYFRDGVSNVHPFAKAILDGSNNVLNGYYMYMDKDTGRIHFHGAFQDALGNYQRGHWYANAGISGTADSNQWKPFAISWDRSLVNGTPEYDEAIPQFYFDGVHYGSWEVSTPSGTYVSDAGIPMSMCSIRTEGVDPWPTSNFNGYMKDFRVYNKLKSDAEILAIANNENDYYADTDGLVFQGFGVRTDLWDDYVIQTLDRDMKVVDNIYGVAMTPYYDPDLPEGDYVKGYDPTQTSLP